MNEQINDSVNETHEVKKRMLFNKTIIQIFYKIIFSKYRTRQIKTTKAQLIGVTVTVETTYMNT